MSYQNQPQEYYEFIALHWIFDGPLTDNQIRQVASYKPKMSYADVGTAIKNGRRDGMGDSGVEFACMAKNLEEVLTIDTETIPLYSFQNKLRAVCKR